MKYISKGDIHLRAHSPDSHKGDNGRVLIVGGSTEYVGTLALAGLAALKSGADTVKVCAPEKVAWVLNTISPDLMTIKLKGEFLTEGHIKQILPLIQNSDVLLIGNGLGLRPYTKKFIIKLLRHIEIPKVIDADAIKSISIKDTSNSIITPHKRELEIFLENSKLIKSEIENNLGNNILLVKGQVDEIISRSEAFFNKTGNEGMTKGGTGDVLAGLCAGFVAQHYSLLESAKMAAFFNGLAGDLAKKELGYGFLATDLVNCLPRVIY